MIANYRISRGRRVLENAFGILSSRFRVFHEAILLHPDKVKHIVLAFVVMHNMLRAERGGIPCNFEDGDEGDGHARNPPTVPRNRGTTQRPGSTVLLLCHDRISLIY